MFPHNNEGRNELLSTYDVQTLSEVVNHGCESGVCSEHIYYADTIKFFETYPQDICDYIQDGLGTEVLSETLRENDGDLDAWMNDLTWIFIELVAMQVIDEYEQTTLEEENQINDYYNQGLITV